MKHILLAATLLATPALAQEVRQPHAPPKLVVDCTPLAKFKSKMVSDGDTVTVMTPGQFHFLVGVYVGSPVTPEGLPPGNGAMVISHGDSSLVVWTRDNKLACNPMLVNTKLLVVMAKLKAGGDDADTL